MIVSMTGFGRSKQESDPFKVMVEIKSVNHRFCEISVRMPRPLLLFEDKIKKIVQQYIHRGRVDVFITVEGQGYINRSLEVDWDLVAQYKKALMQAQANLDIQGSLSLDQLVQLPDVFSVIEKDAGVAEVETVLLAATEQAVVELQKMRQTEGTSLKTDMLQRLKLINDTVQFLKSFSSDVVERYKERLFKKIQDILSGQNYEIDENRILTEVAIFADKADINEELTRLESHVEQFIKILESTGSVGRKLDFLVQEMNREMNTVGSKANDVHISQRVVEMKSELEKIKEQVQNIE